MIPESTTGCASLSGETASDDDEIAEMASIDPSDVLSKVSGYQKSSKKMHDDKKEPAESFLAPIEDESESLHLGVETLEALESSAETLAMDDSVRHEPSSKSTNTSSTRTNISTLQAFQRGKKLIDIVNQELVGPIALALVRGLPSDWNSFWEQPVVGGGTQTLAECVVSALEKMGPTYVKFGQALASRPDVVPRSLALQLSKLQDQMEAFDTNVAKKIIRDELGAQQATNGNANQGYDLDALIESLSPEPVAAASIGEVYSGYLTKGNGSEPQKIAIKVQRPGIRDIVAQDTGLLLKVVKYIESLPALPGSSSQSRLVQTDLSGAVNEFMSRVLEELDYHNEARNLQTFADLYSERRFKQQSKGTKRTSHLANDEGGIQVIVPAVYSDLCTDHVLVMEWIEGTKLVDVALESVEDYDPQTLEENLALVKQGIECTLSQLLDTGIMHADPHGGNLLKVLEYDEATNSTLARLGYVDFGLLATIPVDIRDGLICAIAQLVFAKNIQAVADLFGELALIPDEVLEDPEEMKALGEELEKTLSQVLFYDNSDSLGNEATRIPTLRFDKLLDALFRLVPRFRFQLPPYFLNNARALSTVEGIARELQPDFNVLTFVYPYALSRLVANPSESPIVSKTVQSLIGKEGTVDQIDLTKVYTLLEDLSTLTGYSKFRVLKDIWKASPSLAKRIGKAQLAELLQQKLRRPRQNDELDVAKIHARSTRQSRWARMANYFRL